MPAVLPRPPFVTAVLDDAASWQRRLVTTAALDWAHVAPTRLCRHDRLIGRDLLTGNRLVVLDWRHLAQAVHLHELLRQRRGMTIVFVAEDDAVDGEAVRTLRRFAGHVVAVATPAAATLSQRLLIPIDLVPRSETPRALAKAVLRGADALDDVERHLGDAREFVRRNDPEAALGEATRALVQAPDQPGIVADAARLLFQLGRRRDAIAICERFLAQRPDAERVLAARDEIRALTPN
ncbi:MAG: tetratricopeptide repeat protein [Planctomycetes bacterium]|nr:tetratricopeptide repeat protein [Planctomycetota bacterium]